jgi:hypothetical protein
MGERLYCPRCGNPIQGREQRSTSWPGDISKWSLKQIALLWIGGLALAWFVYSMDPQYIGVALVPYLMVLFGVPYALVTLTRKWRSSRH